MIFEQHVDDQLGCASYLIGDADAGLCAVIDPHVDARRCAARAAQLGLAVRLVLETHMHADHVSGAAALRGLTGATLAVSARAGSQAADERFEDGASWRLGAVEVRAVATPGHRPEHTSFALVDHARGDDVVALVAGDSLLVGDVARPDLAVDARDGAVALAGSLRQRVLSLADHVELWPGHTGASRCGTAALDHKPSSTIGFERRHNPALRTLGSGDGPFAALVMHGLPARPVNDAAIVPVNRAGGRDRPIAFRELTVAGASARAAEDAVLVDTRAAAEYDRGHAPAAVWLPGDQAGFAASLAVLGTERVVLLAERARWWRLAVALAAVGLPDPEVAPAAPDAWRAAGHAVERLWALTAEDAARLAGQRPTVFVDARGAEACACDGLPGAVGLAAGEPIPLLPAEAAVVAVCASGLRARTVASLLAAAGRPDVAHVVGGGVAEVRAALERLD